jgi:hypothetical protein
MLLSSPFLPAHCSCQCSAEKTQSIPREDVLVIPSGWLRRNATVVLEQVLQFLDLSYTPQDSAMATTTSTEAAVKEHFPSKSSLYFGRGCHLS